jgi:hypothetical protein
MYLVLDVLLIIAPCPLPDETSLLTSLGRINGVLSVAIFVSFLFYDPVIFVEDRIIFSFINKPA